MKGPPVERFGEHVAAFVWRGVIELDDPVLRTYWDNVPGEARGHMVETLGRWARDVELTPELVERLQTSWGFVKENARPRELQTELAGLAWWFLAPGLPVHWRLGEMQALLDQAVRPAVASSSPKSSRVWPPSDHSKQCGCCGHYSNARRHGSRTRRATKSSGCCGSATPRWTTRRASSPTTP
jgi:hypothetical protein